jgi:mRNA deadenylase 3'-5' endonuclease subunit Ccr4
MKKWFFLTALILLVACSDQPRQVIDSPFEFIRYKDDRAESLAVQGSMVEFLMEAEQGLRAPFESTTTIGNDIVILPKKFKTKDQLIQYAEKYLERSQAHRWVELVVNDTESKPGEYLAVATDHDHISILDAKPGTINIIENTTLVTTVEMIVEKNERRYRLQYVIMKNQRGEEPKIYQKLLQD